MPRQLRCLLAATLIAAASLTGCSATSTWALCQDRLTPINPQATPTPNRISSAGRKPPTHNRLAPKAPAKPTHRETSP